jgi:hypothetical protein
MPWVHSLVEFRQTIIPQAVGQKKGEHYILFFETTPFGLTWYKKRGIINRYMEGEVQ